MKTFLTAFLILFISTASYAQYPFLLFGGDAALIDIVDEGAGGFESSIGTWVTFGGNVIEQDTDPKEGIYALHFDYIDNSTATLQNFRETFDLSEDLVVGEDYQIKIWVKVVGNVRVEISNGATFEYQVDHTNTSYEEIDVTFTAQHISGGYIRAKFFGGIDEIWFDEYRMYKL
ncbi:MAG: hypothetical protein GY804_09755 [Alphaproteobacteria bacterium]|nr:hypothetical protein [Alphaproteobacteria bacterium]